MQHRHLNTTRWTLAAIDSLLERGDLPDWRDLFAQVRTDRELARRVLYVARAHHVPGASAVAEFQVLRIWPELDALVTPDRGLPARAGSPGSGAPTQ